MSYGTYNGWRRQGRTVMQGERAEGRNEWGDKIFHISQTTKLPRRHVTYDRFGNKVIYVNN